MATYSVIYNIKDPKERLFSAMDRIKEIKTLQDIVGITEESQRELENLEVLK